MEGALVMLVLLVGAVGVGWYWMKYKLPQEKAAQEFQREVERAENKVKVSDPISRRDIELLEKAQSMYANDAISLRRRQVEQGRTPD